MSPHALQMIMNMKREVTEMKVVMIIDNLMLLVVTKLMFILTHVIN